MAEGTAVGSKTGASEGTSVGAALGTDEGEALGVAVGSAEGALVGTGVTSAVGAEVGVFEGYLVCELGWWVWWFFPVVPENEKKSVTASISVRLADASIHLAHTIMIHCQKRSLTFKKSIHTLLDGL